VALDKKYVVDIKGKQFVTYAGLLSFAHDIGLRSIETDLVRLEKTESGILALFSATVTSNDGNVFMGYGDATDKNVGKMIRPHLIRMAETRAKSRALRDFCNIDLCSVEELGGSDTDF